MSEMIISVTPFIIFLFGWLMFDRLTFNQNSTILKLETAKNKKLLDMINRNLRDVAALKPSREEELIKWNTPKLLKEG